MNNVYIEHTLLVVGGRAWSRWNVHVEEWESWWYEECMQNAILITVRKKKIKNALPWWTHGKWSCFALVESRVYSVFGPLEVGIFYISCCLFMQRFVGIVYTWVLDTTPTALLFHCRALNAPSTHTSLLSLSLALHHSQLHAHFLFCLLSLHALSFSL